jgi:uncharacterized membrane protein YozB (DUF420 family)
MDGKVIFWSGAFLNMLLIAGLAIHGVRCARRREFARHARAMRAAALLVAFFLLSYVSKLALLGREELETWSRASVDVLRFHELCVLAMLVGGGLALAIGRRLRATRLVTGAATDPAPAAPLLRRHRAAGRTALAGALLGAASAAVVLAGMYARAGFVELPALARAESAPAAD